MKQLKIIILPLLSTVHLHLLMFELQSKLFGKISSPNLFHQQMMNNSPKIISPICYPFKAPPKTKSAKTTYSSKSLLKKLVAFCQPGFLCQMWPSLISGRGQNRPDCQGKQGRKDLLCYCCCWQKGSIWIKEISFSMLQFVFYWPLTKECDKEGSGKGGRLLKKKMEAPGFFSLAWAWTPPSEMFQSSCLFLFGKSCIFDRKFSKQDWLVFTRIVILKYPMKRKDYLI